MAFKKHTSVFLVLIILLSVFSIVTFAETSTTTYKIEYRGFESEFKQFDTVYHFESGLPEEAYVEAGSSYTISDIEPKFDDYNFRDYTFDGWNYKKKNGIIDRTVTYHAGDVIENINCDIQLIAVWKRKETDIIVYSMLSYLRGDNNDPKNIEGNAPKDKLLQIDDEITLINCPYTYDGYKFIGWMDYLGNLYDAGDKYKVTSFNSVFTATWSSDPAAVVKHSVNYKEGAIGVTGSSPNNFKLYKKDYFTVAENTYEYDGYKFVGWIDNKNDTYMPGEKYTVASSDGDITLTASWEKLPDIFDISVTTNTGGSVTPNGQFELQQGEELNLTIIPDENYVVKTVKVNDVDTKVDNNQLNVTDVEDNLNIQIEFALKTFSISLDIGENGSISPSDLTTIEIGSNVSYTITANSGYEIAQITVDGETVSVDGGVIAFQNVTTNHFISAIFKQSETSSNTEVSKIEEPLNDYTGLVIAILLVVLSIFGLVAIYVVNNQKKSRKRYNHHK